MRNCPTVWISTVASATKMVRNTCHQGLAIRTTSPLDFVQHIYRRQICQSHFILCKGFMVEIQRRPTHSPCWIGCGPWQTGFFHLETFGIFAWILARDQLFQICFDRFQYKHHWFLENPTQFTPVFWEWFVGLFVVRLWSGWWSAFSEEWTDLESIHPSTSHGRGGKLCV